MQEKDYTPEGSAPRPSTSEGRFQKLIDSLTPEGKVRARGEAAEMRSREKVIREAERKERARRGRR